MPEQSPAQSTTSDKPAKSAKDLYSNYKIAVSYKEYVDSHKRHSFKNAIRLTLAGAFIELQSATADNAVIDAKRQSADDIAANYDYRVNEAIHDFYNDPANDGKALNLPENGLPEMATNVQPLPEQGLPKHN